MERKVRKKQCEGCGQAKKGEPLYTYNNRLLCVYCIAAQMTETSIGVEYAGDVGEDINEAKS